MKLKNSAGRSYFWQWDLCQKLIVEDDCACKEVHFCNGTSETSLVCLIEEVDGVRTAKVPNILLQTEGMLTAYLCTRTEDGTETKISQHFQVLPRAKPDDYVYTETEVLNYHHLAERIDQIEKNGISDKQIASAVEKYLDENPIDTGSKLTIGVVELLADKWVGSENLYSQVVSIDGVTPYSQVDLTPGVEQLAVFYEKDLTFVTENDDGVVTVHAIGQKPTNDYTIQVTIKEVSA